MFNQQEFNSHMNQSLCWNSDFFFFRSQDKLDVQTVWGLLQFKFRAVFKIGGRLCGVNVVNVSE